jgi:adenosylcobinamide-phosphate synthase
VLLMAAALDAALGEPPPYLHPVVWLGRLAAALERLAPRHGRGRQLAWGAITALLLPATAALAGALAARGYRALGKAGWVAEATLLKGAFAVRALLVAGEAVRRALVANDGEAARAALRALVSRDTRGLTAGLMAAAAIESLAENTTDSFVAPWLAYLCFGLPGAWAYRAINTLDSMIGYRGRYEYLGKAAARLDDAANWLPARLSAVILAAAAPAGRGSARRALGTAMRQHRRTASLNAGWTMAAMAGALGVRLEKRGAYVLGDGPEPRPEDIRRAQWVVAATAVVTLTLAAGARLACAPARGGGIERR